MKRNKDTFTKYLTFNEIDCQAVEKYLEEKALSGWILYEVNFGFFKFKKSEPKKIKYTVDIFTDYKTGEYRDYCEESGWKYIGETGKYLVFCTEEDNITPIQSDEEMILKKVGKSMRQNIVGYIIWCYIISKPIYTDLFTKDLIKFDGLYDGYDYFLVIVSFVCLVLPLVLTLRSIIWYFKYKRALKLEDEIKYPSTRELKLKIESFNLLVKILIILVITLIGFNFNLSGYIVTALALAAIVIFIKNVSIILKKENISLD